MMQFRKEAILIVDDQTTFRQALKSILSELGFTGIEQASSGREALVIMKKQAIDCVISDWNMPGMDGLELLQWVRTNPGTETIPFMLLTANASRSSIDAALTHGVNDYLIKPFTMQRFTQRILRLLQGKGVVAPRPSPKLSQPVLGLTNLDQEERKSSVLIVDDAKDNIEIAASILEDDYQIQVALSGQKALEIVHGKQVPDLILLDVMMPEMDGYEVCRRLKADELTQNIPVIFMTSKDQPDDVAQGLELGAVDYVVKPVHPTILRARVRSHLRLFKAMRHLNNQSQSLAENARLREEVENINKHDLKNPLSAVLQATERLLVDPDMSDKQKEITQLAADAAHAALEQIDRTLDLLRMETGSYLLEPVIFDLGAMLLRIGKETQLAFSDAVEIKQTNDGQANYMAWGDEGLSNSILSNLLRNAAEAAPSGSQILCHLSLANEQLSITIHNQGAVPVAIRAHFFDKYVTAGKANGTGVGTYTSKLYAEAQNGSLQMQTDDEVGTTLTLTLPVCKQVN
ncbi:response regulator [Chitinibacter fontanus]|uniref:histidine kinase n=1 Tax=Chitinibacter fontanus TaxID=1737446 RepID=A0A7D5ZEP5_9NEIS|nr:response regulator [Chitinibacter fontanus]QLI80429.1 response regulator [Chitinibacter fontanus]